MLPRATVRLSALTYTYWLTRDEATLGESWRRAANLLSWDPDHSTGLRSSDLSNLRISLALALTYDITKRWLSDEQKAETIELIDFLKKKLEGRVSDVTESKRLTDSPCVLVAPQGGMSQNMERLMQMADREFQGGQRLLEINPKHGIISN